MKQDLHKIFKELPDLEPNFSLEDRIIRKISLERRKKNENRLFLANLGLVGSLIAVFYFFFNFGKALFQSDFWSLLSLLFSDTGIVLGYWNSFIFSLLETLPVTDMFFILIPVFALSLCAYLHFKLSEKRRYNFA